MRTCCQEGLQRYLNRKDVRTNGARQFAVLVPTPKRILQTLLLCGATFGFFKYFRVDGLDGVTLALRDSIGGLSPSDTALTANGFSIPSIDGQGNTFASGLQGQGAPSNPFANANGSTGPQAASDGLWATQANPQVMRATYANSKPPSEPNYVRPGRLLYLSTANKIRVGSFHRETVDLAMVRDPFTSDRLMQILSEYACVAIQFVDVSNRSLMPELMNLLNATGKRYEYIDGSVDRETRQKGLAIIFDTTQLQVDRHQTYSLRDDSGKLTCEPLVAWFRCVAADPKDAFTFTFVNAYLAQTAEISEVDCLPDIFSSILADGRNEDDIILAGSIAHNPAIFQKLTEQGIKIAQREAASGSDNAQTQTVMISSMCREYTGNSGAFNILRRYNLTPQEAGAISTSSPVWAEFDVTEGGMN